MENIFIDSKYWIKYLEPSEISFIISFCYTNKKTHKSDIIKIEGIDKIYLGEYDEMYLTIGYDDPLEVYIEICADISIRKTDDDEYEVNDITSTEQVLYIDDRNYSINSEMIKDDSGFLFLQLQTLIDKSLTKSLENNLSTNLSNFYIKNGITHVPKQLLEKIEFVKEKYSKEIRAHTVGDKYNI